MVLAGCSYPDRLPPVSGILQNSALDEMLATGDIKRDTGIDCRMALG